MDPTTIATILKQLRQRRHLTQKDLAHHMNVTHQAVSRWENGVSVPDIQTLMALAEFYDVSVDAILGKSAMYVPDNDNLERANRLIERLWRFVLVPVLLFFVSLSLTLTWFVRFDRTIQWSLSILITLLFLTMAFTRTVRSRQKAALWFYGGTFLLLLSTFLVWPSSFHRIDVPPLVAASSSAISLPVMEAETLLYVDSRQGADATYGVLFEVEGDTIHLVRLDPEDDMALRHLRVPRGAIRNVFVYEDALHAATFDANNDQRTTRIYRLDEDMDRWTLPYVQSGWFHAYAGNGTLLLVPSPLESMQDAILQWNGGSFVPIAGVYEPIHDMVLHHGTYVSILDSGGMGYVGKMEHDFHEYLVIANTDGLHAEAPTLTEAGLDTVIHSNEGQHLIRDGERIASLPGDTPVQYSGGDYFLQDGALYDRDWNLVSRTSYETDSEIDVRASYLFFHPQGGYVALTNEELVRLDWNPIDPMVLDRFSRTVLFLSAGLVGPLVMMGAVRVRQEDVL